MRSASELALIAFVSLVSMGAGQAAEKIRYEEIPDHIGRFGEVLAYRGFTVVTIDGTKYQGRQLRLEADHVVLFRDAGMGDSVPSEQVERIEIRQTGRYIHHVLYSALVPLLFGAVICQDSGSACLFIVSALFSPTLAYTAVTAPFFLAADAIGFFLPPKVYEIIH
jgi:hypothetical protein